MTECKLCETEIECDFYEHIRKQHLTFGAKMIYRNSPVAKSLKQTMLLKVYTNLVTEYEKEKLDELD